MQDIVFFDRQQIVIYGRITRTIWLAVDVE